MANQPHSSGPMNAHSASISRLSIAASVWPFYVLFFLSGAAGLVYEVMWTRSFSLVFGSTTRAGAAVLASFFAGMALGSLLGGRLANRRSTAILLYAAAEVTVALGALLTIFWLALYQRWYPVIYQSDWAGRWGLTPIRLSLAFFALAIPTIGMGATLPLMSRAVVTYAGHVGRRAAGIYAVNTVGATLGVLLAGFVLPAYVGVRDSVFLAAAVNIIVAGLAFGMWRLRRRTDDVLPAESAGVAAEQRVDASSASRIEQAPKKTPRSSENRLILFAAALSGFGTLALEVLYTRLIMTETDFSVYSFAVMLAVFLVFLAVGSFVVSAIGDRAVRPWRLLAVAQTVAAPLIMASPQLLRWAVAWTRHQPPSSFSFYLVQIVLTTAIVLGPAVVLIGTVLPAVWKVAVRQTAEVGGRIGRLTAVNTLAAVVGSVGAGFLVIPKCGVGQGFVLIAIVYALLAMACWNQAGGSKRSGEIGAVVLLLLAGPYLMKWWAVGPTPTSADQKLVSFGEGEGGAVAVFQGGTGERMMVINNRYVLGGTSPVAIAMQKGQGRLPLMLHPAPVDVAFIGVATAISVSSIQEAPSVRHVLAMELIPGVIQAAADFEAANGEVLHDPRVRVLVADGRNHLFGTSEQFDVIVGDLFIPWEAGTGYLYTAEHFRSVARRLKPGGIFVQWFPSYQLSLEEFRIITATFMDVFPGAALWIHEADPKAPLLALVGFNALPGLSGSCVDRPDLAALGMRCVQNCTALRQWSQSAQRNTDDRPVIEFSAGATHFGYGRRDRARFIETQLHLPANGASGRPGA